MKSCEEIKESLGPLLDHELEASAVEPLNAHLNQCPGCFAEKERLAVLDGTLKSALESRSSEVSFDAIWSGVERRIEKAVPWYQHWWDRIVVMLPDARPRWAVPIAAVLLLVVFSALLYLPRWRASNGFTFVESVDAHGSNFALFRQAETRTTVIWLFEDLENHDEAPEESSTVNPSF
jgi:anti-sigma factor RsiW